MTDRQPTEREVLQEEPQALETVPVRVVSVDGPVRTQTLPRKAAMTRTWSLGASGTAIRILTADPYRATALLVADKPIYMSTTQTGADDLITCTWWPANVPLPITAVAEVWVRAVSDAATLGVIAERWATGDTHADD